MADKTPITAEIARQLLRYEPETGKLFWLERPREMFPVERQWKTWNTRYAGREAFTTVEGNGYRTGGIYHRLYKAHRVIWLLQTGAWPENYIDHINGIPSDNRWVNLRPVTNSENRRNSARQRNNSSGINGVSWHKTRQKWSAWIKTNGRQKHIGLFDTIEAATKARLSANAEHGFTSRHGTQPEQ